MKKQPKSRIKEGEIDNKEINNGDNIVSTQDLKEEQIRFNYDELKNCIEEN